MVFDRRRDDVSTGGREAANCEIVGFRSAADKDDFRCLSVNQLCDMPSRVIHERFRMLSEPMDGRWIAEMLCKDGHHRRHHLWPHRSGCVTIKIDASHSMIITLTTDFGLSDPFVGIMKGVIL